MDMMRPEALAEIGPVLAQRLEDQSGSDRLAAGAREAAFRRAADGPVRMSG
jgi:hypothetical protein